MILLLVLIYFFRVELYMSGVRAATLISPNPAWDTKLGDYYKELSEKSAVLSQQFYDTAAKDKAAVVKTKDEQTETHTTKEVHKPK
jgi:hypothetical protein